MRILIANDGFGDAGGVQTYLDAVAGGLAARGHELAVLYSDTVPPPRADSPDVGLPTFSGVPPISGRRWTESADGVPTSASRTT